MAEISSAPISIPLIFFDGNVEIDAGTVAFDPSLGFEKLQSLIGHKIGVDPSHVAVFLSRRKKPRSQEHRKIPIHKNSDLAAIARERNCFFFAVSKPPPKRERRRKPRRNLDDDSDRIPTLLRRNPAAAPEFRSPPEAFARALGLGFMDYEEKIRELQRSAYLHTNPHIYGLMSGGTNRIVCEQCLSQERPIPFHLCVYDAVTFGFRSPAGPIERPSK